MDSKVLSPAHRLIAIDRFCDYIRSDATQDMSNNMWLTVVDICNRANEGNPKLKEAADYSRQMFEQGFDFEALRTDLRKEDHEPSTGRKVKRIKKRRPLAYAS